MRSIGAGPVVDYPQTDFSQTAQRDDLAFDTAGKVKPAIDRSTPLRDTAEAIADWEQGQARGQVLVPAA